MIQLDFHICSMLSILKFKVENINLYIMTLQIFIFKHKLLVYSFNAYIFKIEQKLFFKIHLCYMI